MQELSGNVKVPVVPATPCWSAREHVLLLAHPEDSLLVAGLRGQPGGETALDRDGLAPGPGADGQQAEPDRGQNRQANDSARPRLVPVLAMPLSDSRSYLGHMFRIKAVVITGVVLPLLGSVRIRLRRTDPWPLAATVL